jgi:hypothetical protein
MSFQLCQVVFNVAIHDGNNLDNLLHHIVLNKDVSFGLNDTSILSNLLSVIDHWIVSMTLVLDLWEGRFQPFIRWVSYWFNLLHVWLIQFDPWRINTVGFIRWVVQFEEGRVFWILDYLSIWWIICIHLNYWDYLLSNLLFLGWYLGIKGFDFLLDFRYIGQVGLLLCQWVFRQLWLFS